MFAAVNAYGFGGAETRAISAVDIALWDILGQYTGQPVYNLPRRAATVTASRSTTHVSATAPAATQRPGWRATAVS